MGLPDGPESWWLHEIRQDCVLLNGEKRVTAGGDMRGIESTAGIDKLATTKAMNSTKIPPEQRNDLRELCGCVLDTKRGILTLIAWRGHRAPRDVVSFWRTLSLSPGQTWGRAHAHIRSVETPCQTVCFRMRDLKAKPKNDRVVAWTVGACVCKQDARFRRAGCGVFILWHQRRQELFLHLVRT